MRKPVELQPYPGWPVRESFDFRRGFFRAGADSALSAGAQAGAPGDLLTGDFIYLNQRKGYWYYPLPTYDFLYDANPFNDIRAYLNGHFLGCLVRWSEDPACVGRVADLDRPNAWMGKPEEAEKFGGLDAWCRARNNAQIRDVYEKLSEAAHAIRAGTVQVPEPSQTGLAITYIEDNLIALIKEYPETQFHLVFPPYSRAKYAIWHQYRQGYAETHHAVVHYLTELSTRLPNLTCDECKTYLKIFYLEKDPAMEPVADDLATLALDLLVDQQGYNRVGANLLVFPGRI